MILQSSLVTRINILKYSVPLRSLGKAATQCSDMATYLRVSVCLFLVAADVCYKYDVYVADDKGRDTLVKFLRNYITLVLLVESISMGGTALEKPGEAVSL